MKYCPVLVEIFNRDDTLVKEYWIDYNDKTQRSVLDAQSRDVFKAGQTLVMTGTHKFGEYPA